MKNNHIFNLSFHWVNLTCQKNASYVHGVDFTAYVHLGTRPLQMLGNGKSDDLVKFLQNEPIGFLLFTVGVFNYI